MRTRIPVMVLGILTLITVAAGTAADRRFERKFTVTPGGTLRVHTDIGSVKVTGGSGSEVSVLVEMKGREGDIEDFSVSAEQDAGGVTVRGDLKSLWSWGGRNLDVRFTILVPREYNLSLETSGGDLAVGSLKGSVSGETSGGDIRAREIEGKTDLRTSGGDAYAEKVVGELSLETSGGDIVVNGVKGNTSASTSGGNVKIADVDGRAEAETSGGHVSLSVTGPNRGIKAETSGGDIEISIGKDVGARIDAGTSGGEVVCDLPITVSGKISESSIRGSVNGGGELIHARTSGGDIRIRALP